MLRCNDCRPLLLDHLYGLLDAPEVVAVETHLASCPACAAERAEAAKVQGLIAKAAKGAFPAVRFEAPEDAATRPMPKVAQAPAPKYGPTVTLPVPVVPITAPEPNRPAAGRGSRRAPGGPSAATGFFAWAVAAAVLVAIPGTIFPVLNLLNRAEVARNDAAAAVEKASAALREFESTGRDAERRRALAHANLLAAKQNHDNLLARWVDDEAALARNQEARKLTWEVMKPAAVQPGAPNEFLLVVRDRGNNPSGRVVAEFRDETDAVIHSQQINHEGKNEHPLRLPASVWTGLKPQSELFLVVSRVDEKTLEQTVIQDKVRLLGPVFATVLTTDKPEYRPGESVRFRSLTLDRVTFTPPARDQFLQYELRGPNGLPVRTGPVTGSTELVRVVEGKVSPIDGPDGKPVRGVGTGEFLLPTNLADGEYTLAMRELPHPAGMPPVVRFPATRTFKVCSGAAEATRKEVGYAAASYSAGDTVEAWAELKFKNSPVAGAEASAVAVADEQVLEVQGLRGPVTDAEGRARFRFKLPAALSQGDVRLRVTFRVKQGKDVIEESVTDRVPVIGPNLVVEFFPEGGDLVAGVPCRVYVRATTPTGQPVDVTGSVTDGRRTLAKVETLTDEVERGVNRGLGVFTFTPELGIPVWLKLNSPSGAYSPLLTPDTGKFPTVPAAVAGCTAVTAARTGFLLPKPKREGVVMTVHDPVTSPGKPIRVHLRSVGQVRRLVVGAYTRGRLSDTQHVTAKPGETAEVRLMAGADPRGGVVRVTVFEEPEEVAGEAKQDLVPVAERLVFRRPGEALNLNFTTTGTRQTPEGFAPGSRVNLNVAATDEKGNPAAAILYAAAVNTAVASGAKDRLLTTHFLLAGEVSTPDAMEYADFLLTDHARAGQVLDLVLATQGWRRFAEQVPAGYARKPSAHTQERADLLVCNGQYMTAAEPTSVQEQQKLRDRYWPRYEEAVKNLDAARVQAEAAAADNSGVERARRLATAANQAREAAKVEAELAELAVQPVERFRGAGWFAVGGFGLLAAMLASAALLRRSGRIPFGLGTLGSVGIAAFLVVSLGMADATQAAAESNADFAKLQVAHVPPPPPAEAALRLQANLGGVTLSEADASPGDKPETGRRGAANGIQEKQLNDLKNKDGQNRTEGGGGATGGNANGSAFGGGFATLGGIGGAAGAAPPAGPGAASPQVAVAPKKVEGYKDQAAQAPGVRGPQRPQSSPAPAMTSPPAAPNPGGAAPKAAPEPQGAVTGGLWQLDQLKQPRGDSGWQPGRAKWVIPSENLKKREAESLLRERERNDFARRDTPNAKADAKPGDARLLDGKAFEAGKAAAAKDKSDADSYRKSVEQAKSLMEKRAQLFRSRIEDSLRQGKGEDAARDEQAAKAVPYAKGAQNDRYATTETEARALSRVQAAVPALAPLVVREYAAPRPGTDKAFKSAASLEGDTILWQPVIVLPTDGKLTLDVQLGSAQGGYEVVLAGHTLNGRLGAVRGIIPVATDATDGAGTPVPQPGNVDPNAP